MEPKKTLKSTEKKTMVKKAKVITPVKKVAPKVSNKLPAKKLTAEKTKVSTNKKTAVKLIKQKNLGKKVVAAGKPKTNKKIKEEVSIPDSMSLRAIEKAHVISNDLESYIKVSALKIAYVSGLCFILIGASFSANIFLPDVNKIRLGATVVDSTKTTTFETLVAEPKFSFISNIENHYDSETSIKFSVSDVIKVSPKIIKVDQVGFYDVETENLSGTNYRLKIPADRLAPGFYQINVYTIAAIDSKARVFQSKVFRVGKDTGEEPPKEIEETTEEAETIPVEEKPAPTITNNFEIFSISSDTLSGFATIGLNAPVEAKNIELYARPLQVLNARFVTLSQLRFEKPRFDFNSANIPNGKYEFFAKAKIAGELVTTKSIILTVSNNSYSSPNSDSLTELASRPTIVLEDTDFESSQSLEEDVAIETKKLVSNNEEDLNYLLKIYAVARQTNNDLIIQSAEEALREKKEELVLTTLNNESTRSLSDEISVELSRFIENVQIRIDTFEQIRRERSRGLTAIDTDGDGISDFDEINIYKTNPLSADTDKDGVIDSIEIIRGSDPLNPSSEGIIAFESPRESFGLVRDDILKIESVTPIFQADVETDESILKTEIKGKALPSSFVTLFIFSSPTVVTIKTEDDGSFEYTFNKELEDGRHEIYIAITDNAGRIIAQSNAFAFIKEARAFTPVDAENESVLNSVTAQQYSKNEETINVVGMGILALGLILIMLGITLRPKIEVIENNNKEVKAT